MRRVDIHTAVEATPVARLPLLPLLDRQPTRPFVWANGVIVTLQEFSTRMAALAANLPFTGAENVPLHPASMINLCEDRYHFLLAYCAALTAGHATLLPASRAPAVIAELESIYGQSYRIDDAAVAAAGTCGTVDGETCHRLQDLTTVMIAFTSGSTGRSKSFPKTWFSVATSTALNARSIRNALNLLPEGPTPWIVATVPPQHMYGMEFSVLLPMLGGMAVHSGRPLLPADIAQALSEIPAPRVLVTTPVHLRVLMESGIDLPPLAGVISATAPFAKELALQVEQRFATILFEMFGSTETCIFATRRTAHEEAWQLYPEVEITPRPDGAQIASPWLAEPMLLQDIVEVLHDGGFVIRGRNTDFVDVAGKRASLADLTRRLLAVDGVQDAIVFPPEQSGPGQARRVAALAVAPGLTERAVLERLSASVDPAFLPRPLLLVDRLPRNETGKLPREQLIECLKQAVRE